MKIVFAGYTRSMSFNDPGTWIKNIRAYTGVLEALAKKHSVISVEQIDYRGEYTNNNVRYFFERFSKLEKYFPIHLHLLLRKMKPDVIIIHGFHNPLQAMQLRFFSTAKIIVQHHAEKPFTGIKKKLQYIASSNMDAYLFASAFIGEDWVAKGNLRLSGRVREVMELSSVFSETDKQGARAYTKASGDPVFLWVGRLNENKDPVTVVRAFLKFSEEQPLAKFYMIYQTEELLPEIKSMLEKNNRSDAVKLVGKVPHEEMQHWYNAADFIISGSHYEGSGTAVCEAMSCGCVPVITDIFSFRTMTDNGDCGFLYPPGNETALLSILRKTEIVNVEEMKKKALIFFRENLSFEAIAEKIHQVAVSV